jgi:hypothetical protein
VIRNVILRNVLARGVGPCLIHGHPDSPLENISLENVRLEIAGDPEAPYPKGENAITLENARNFCLKEVEIAWESPNWEGWRSALAVQNAQGLILDGVFARPAPGSPDAPAILLKDTQDAVVKHCAARAITGVFLELVGESTQDILLWANDTRRARTPVKLARGVKESALTSNL